NPIDEIDAYELIVMISQYAKTLTPQSTDHSPHSNRHFIKQTLTYLRDEENRRISCRVLGSLTHWGGAEVTAGGMRRGHDLRLARRRRRLARSAGRDSQSHSRQSHRDRGKELRLES
ncbi:hypothetical protein HAX54_020178, partial [Datura stramonium]|nr:hypothetical protein [Datura stramonium]